LNNAEKPFCLETLAENIINLSHGDFSIVMNLARIKTCRPKGYRIALEIPKDEEVSVGRD
jgi:hypothetical protein